MLLPLEGRRIYYDLTGAEDGPVVCMTHSLMSDSGMWSEQKQALANTIKILKTCAPKSLIGVVSACRRKPNGPILSLSLAASFDLPGMTV